MDLREQRIDPELFRTIQADLMFRYNFVPLEVRNNVLSIAVAEPSQVALTDELQLLLGKKLSIKVATARQIGDILKRTEQSLLCNRTKPSIRKTKHFPATVSPAIPPPARSSNSLRPSSSPRSSAARATFTLRRAMEKSP